MFSTQQSSSRIREEIVGEITCSRLLGNSPYWDDIALVKSSLQQYIARVSYSLSGVCMYSHCFEGVIPRIFSWTFLEKVRRFVVSAWTIVVVGTWVFYRDWKISAFPNKIKTFWPLENKIKKTKYPWTEFPFVETNRHLILEGYCRYQDVMFLSCIMSMLRCSELMMWWGSMEQTLGFTAQFLLWN